MSFDLANKAWLMDEAKRAMPEHLLEHALTIDSTPPPRDRTMPIWETPPIKDFDVRQFAPTAAE